MTRWTGSISPGGRLAAALAAVLAVAVPTAAGPPGLDPSKAITQYGLDVWTTDQGLPSATVNVVLQTREGYLWVGTYDGLARFDGVRFTVFTRSTTPEIGNNGIRALCEDKQGALWIGTNGGGLTRFASGRFTRFTTADGLPSDNVWALSCDDPTGRVWAGTNGGGLAAFDRGRFTAVPAADSGRVVRALLHDGDGLWVATQSNGLRRRGRDGRWTTYSTDQGIPAERLTALTRSRDGSLWVGSAGGGLVRFRDGQVLPQTPELLGLGKANVASLVEDRAGSLWIGLNEGGVARLAGTRLSIAGAADGLPGDVILSVFEDREGSLWIGTYGAGLGRLRDGSFTSFTSREGLSRDFVYTALADHAGQVWVGTAAGLDHLQGNTFVRLPLPLPGPVAVRSLAEDAEGALWVGTYGAGVLRWAKGRWTVYSTSDGLANNSVRAVLVDRAGRVWAATPRGLSVLEGPRWRTYGATDGLPVDSLITLAEDGQGGLWIGTDGGGLARFDDGRFHVVTAATGLASNLILALHAQRDGTLWIGTNGGLSRWQNGRLAKWTGTDGLPTDEVTQVRTDGLGNVWVGTSRGVCRVPVASLDAVAAGKATRLDVVGFDRADGLKSTQFTAPGTPGSAQGRDGRLWFCTTRGVVAVDPNRIRSDTSAPPVVMEEVQIDGRPVDVAGGVVVPPGRVRLELRYAAMSLLAPARVSFRFRLDGFDRGWVESRDRRAEYTGVPPGDYVFRAAARLPGGVWGEEGSRAVRVQPRFYQTGAFAAFVVLAAAGLVMGGHRLRVRRLNAGQRALTALVEDRTRSLAEEKGQVERLLAERVQSQEALQKSEAAHRDLFEQGQALLCTHDLDGVILSVNPAAAEALERSPADMVGRNLRELLTERAVAMFPDYLATLRRDHAASGVIEFLTARGEARSWRYRNVLREPQGGPPYVIGFSQDVTEERLARRALRESEERFRQLTENIEAVFFMREVDPPRFLYASPSYERVWGRPRELSDAGVDAVLDSVVQDDRERVAAAVARGAEGYDIEFRILRPDGTMRWIRSRTFPVRDARGGVSRVAGIAEDVTERKLAEQLREDLTHTLVHDLKNPLAIILGGVELLGLTAARTLGDADKQVLQGIEISGRRLLGLLENILEVSRLEAGAWPLEPQRVALSTLVDETLEMQRPLAAARLLSLGNAIPPGLPDVRVDRALVGRVLQNLLGNAIKFTPEGGTVRVEAGLAEDPRLLAVLVCDTGSGIPDEMRGRLFQKFASGRQPGRGSGLGLLFCRLAVEAHGGRIWAGSEPGRGATFTFTLPLAEAGAPGLL